MPLMKRPFCYRRPLLHACLLPDLNTIPNNFVEEILFSSVVMVLPFCPGIPDSNPVWTLLFLHKIIHLFLCHKLYLRDAGSSGIGH